MKNRSHRIASIDVFRALTMLLMIWVNDFWTLEEIPKWLKHAEAGEDYLGFSDLIFPWFLFIVGMSIPFAISNRLAKGDNNFKLLLHIVTRSIALLVMGVFLVNTESYHTEATGMTKPWYVILMISGFFLIWNVYPASIKRRKSLFYGLQALGVILLIYLAIIYRGTTYTDEKAVVIMQTRWWGILGIIGWTYLVAAVLYLYFNKFRFSMWLFFIFFIVLSIAGNSGIDYSFFPQQDNQWFIGNGAFHVYAFGGIIASQILLAYRHKKSRAGFYIALTGIALFFLIAGFFTNEFFIISKITATPPWVFFSLSSALVLFVLLHWLVDVKNKAHWFISIKTAGTATLTCYLVPYYFYSLRTLTGMEMPEFFRAGFPGLIKSMIYAFIIIWITQLLGKIKIRLKI